MMQEFSSPRVATAPAHNTSAYTSGDVLAPYTQVNAMGAKQTAVLKDILVKDNDNQKSALTILIYKKRPTTKVANAAFAWGTNDFANLIGKVNVTAADYETVGGKAVAHVQANVAVGSAETDATAATGTQQVDQTVKQSFFYEVVVTGTPTYTAGGLTIDMGVLSDG